MSINQQELTVKFLQDEIAIAKRIRSPLFDVSSLQDGKAKYITAVATKITKAAARQDIDTFFLAKLFVKHCFPYSTSHTPIHSLDSKWSRFVETVFDEELLTLCKLTTADVNVDERIEIFFQHWNKLADYLSKAYRAGTSACYIDKASSRDLTPYKTALKIYHYVRPHTILSSTFGDIIIDYHALYKYIKACVETKRIFQANAVMAFLVKKDAMSSKFFVESLEREYINIHKDDPSMILKDLGEVAKAPTIQRDTEAIDKLKQ